MADSGQPDLREVLLSFVKTELAKDHCRLLQSLWKKSEGHAWDIIANVADREKLYVLRKAIEQPDSLTDEECRLAARWLGEFGTERKTLIPFTTGSYADSRNLHVTAWRLMQVPVKDLWIRQTDAATTAVLAKHKHNVVQAIAALKALPNFQSWDQSKNPPPIICLEKQESDVEGTYWVLDGSHRAIARAAQDEEAKMDAYVGTWKEELNGS